ncbi:MAG: hypothetical protein ACQUYJ_17265, partial [Ferruginibacter sp.]
MSFISVFISNISNSQSFENGTSVVSLGIGLGGNFGISNATASPGISVSYEMGVTEVGDVGILGVGAYLGYKSLKYDYAYFGYAAEYKWTYMTVGARGAFHYTGFENDKFDPYAGLMLGYNI